MTSMSLFVLEYPVVRTAAELEAAVLDNPVFQSLSSHARECGPYRLQRWANEHGLDIFYVDNCWVRVPVKGSELRLLFSEVLDPEHAHPDLGSKIVDGDSYLVESEEF